MNKSGLIEELARRENLTEKKATDVVNLIFKGFTEELKNNGRIEIRGLGSFVVRNYQSYTGRNPKTGMNITVSPKRLPFFKVGKELRDMVNLEDEGASASESASESESKKDSGIAE